MKKLKQRLTNIKNFNPVIMLFYGLIVGAAGYLIIVSRAAPAPPTLYLTPASQNMAVNTTFTVDVRENSGTTGINAVLANISYPASLVDFVSIDTTGSAFGIKASTTGGSGNVNIQLASGTTTTGCPSGQSQCGLILTGDQLVARVTFKSRTTGGTANVAFITGTSLVSATTNSDILGSLSATAGGNYVIDATAPTVSLTAPASGATLAGGSTVGISATASDNTTVSKVDILVDGVIKASPTSSPYTYSWNTSGVALGAHTIQAKAYDPYGNSTSTAVNNVTLTDQTAPTVSITSPTNGAPISGTTNITATASDNAGGSGLAKVEFYIDNVLKSTSTTSPYSMSWDSKTSPDGSHGITAKAYDKASPANITTSSTITVNVDNADHTPPSTPGSFRSTTQSLNSITLAWNASTDNVGVTGYRLQRNGTTINTSTALTFTDTGLTSGTTYSYNLVALDAAGNASVAATQSVATLPLKIGDVNNDNKVDIIDLSTLLTNWGTANAICDINHNGTVDIFDLSSLLSNFGN